MWSVKHPNLLKQDNSYTTTCSLADFGAHFREQRLDVTPLDVAARGVGEDQFEGALVPSLHAGMVPLSGTFFGAGEFWPALEWRRFKNLQLRLSERV